MVEFLTNTFCMCGAYMTIAVFSQLIEYINCGEIKEAGKTRRLLYFIVSAAIMIALDVFRQGV